MRARLTESAVRQAQPRDKKFKLFDQGGLYLLVTPQGSKLWRFKYRLGKREGLLSIGRYPEIGLAKARDIHRQARLSLGEGINPSAKKKADRLLILENAANTFESATTFWIARKRETRSAGYANSIERTFKHDVIPHIGGLPIQKVTTRQLVELLRRLERRNATKLARQLQGWFLDLFAFAIQSGWAVSNPARELNNAIDIKPVVHRPKLSADQIGLLLRQLSTSKSTKPVLLALRLLLLTFVRPGELRNARWAEFDFENCVWTIPAERMKMRMEHSVPLSRQAVALLQDLKKSTPFNLPQLFPNGRDPRRNMSMTTLNRVLERLGWGGKFSAHGFRATASSYLNDEHNKKYRPDAIERQLAHREKNQSRKPYNQAEYWEERKTIMQDWADFLGTLET